MKRIAVAGTFILLVSFGVALVFTDYIADFTARLDIISYNPNPLVRHFAPAWRSLKKVIDIPYVIASMLYGGGQLPVYEIYTSRNDRSNLLNNLPDYPDESRLYEESKKTVKAEFRHNNYVTTDAKIRYRGKTSPHWSAVKKSWQVGLPAETPLDGRTAYRFMLPDDKGCVQPYLWAYLADRLNLMTPDVKPARVVLNNSDMGVYILLEGWEESFLENRRKPFGPIFAERDMPPDKENPAHNDLLRPEGLSKWQNRFDETMPAESFSQLAYLTALTANAPEQMFADEIFTILDKDQFFRWAFAALLSGRINQNNDENLNLYFNPATGKFESIFFDSIFVNITDSIDVGENRLLNRILRHEPFKADFEAFAGSYLEDPGFLPDGLAYYDEIANQIRPAAYRDTQKLTTSFEVASAIKKDRALFEHNFSALKSMIEHGGLALRFAEESYPLGEPFKTDAYASFIAINAARSEFLSKNPQFTAGADPTTIILLPGTHTFTRDVIVPTGLHLVIREGAHLLFSDSVSFISYSPINAPGTVSQPITMRPFFANDKWGVFAVINTGKEKNMFRHVRLQGGRDTTVNGIYFSGMLSLHAADFEFHDGFIEGAGADDGIHVVTGTARIGDSLFLDNSADHIDIDFAAKESLVAHNTFSYSENFIPDKNGDAIDLSFSDIKVLSNAVERCSDKGVSIGEISKPVIKENSIRNCQYGIAVKDQSVATIMNNRMEANEIAIGLYRKKPHFKEGGTAYLKYNIFIDNKQDSVADEYSRLIAY